MDGCGGSWTEERHSAFLNWVEESFVRRVLAARGNDPSPHLDLDVKLGASVWLPPPLPLDRFLPDSATESNRNPGRPARPARTRRSATTAVEAEEPGTVSAHSHRPRGHTSAWSSLPWLRYGDGRCCDRVIFPVGGSTRMVAVGDEMTKLPLDIFGVVAMLAFIGKGCWGWSLLG